MEDKFIIGSKKSKEPKPRTPVEDPNTLQSRAVATFVDLICEGEVEGLVNGEESVYFNQIPIRDSGGAYNFQGATYEFKPGAPDGVSLKDYPTSESERSVDKRLEKGQYAQENISDPDVDDLRLSFTIPSLFAVNSENGDIKKTTVEWFIEIQPSGGAWTTAKNMSKHGKCISSYQTDIKLTQLTRTYGPGPWKIRCARLTDESQSNSLQNDVYWAGITQIINRVLIYPDSCLIGVTINSQQFGSRVPSRSYEIHGTRIQIPSNYNPVDRSYGSTWNGTFQRAYSNNPAWVLYDLATNKRYGLGLDASLVDEWGLLTIAQYCDQLVDDGFGSLEPRFTFNGVMQQRTEVIHAINMICSNFRGMPFWAGGKLRVAQDSPKDPVKLVTAANVVDGLFTYSYSAIDTRYTVANVSWNDPDEFFKLTVEAVDDKDGIERYGYRPADITAVGCTSRGQAYRFGRWFLYTGLNETETISYRASWDQADVVPGDIITVMDNHEAYTRAGGRLVSVSANQVTVDGDGVLLESTDSEGNPITNYAMSFVDPDGNLDERDITNAIDDQYHTVIDLASSWAGDAPQVDSMWIMSSSDLVPREYRVVTNTEIEPNIYEITGVIYDVNKYAEVEDGRIFTPAPITKVPDPNSQLTPPTNMQLEQYTYEDTQGISTLADRKTGMLMSWTHTRDVRFQNYEVQYKVSTGSFADNELIETTDNQYDFRPLGSGSYTFRVRATGLTRESVWLTISEISVTDVPAAPPDVAGLQLKDAVVAGEWAGKDCEIEWNDMVLATDTTGYTPYDGTSIPTHSVDFDSELTKVKDFQIEILNADTDTHLRYDFVTENSYKYLFNFNQLDNGNSPLRRLKFKVWARDIFNQLSNNPSTITGENPGPDMGGLNPTISAVFTGLKVDWSNITPDDSDLAKFLVYMDTNNPPTTLVAELGKATTSWIETGLTADTTYRARILPYDEFGSGTISDVSSGVPLKIAADDIDVELQSRLTITDSYDETSASSFEWMYDHLTESGVPSAVYQSGDWINVAFPTQQLIDRVSIWADQTFDCYLGVSKDGGSTWEYFGGKNDASGDLDSGRLVSYGSSAAQASTNKWTADAGAFSLNIAPFPNGLAMTDCRFFLLTNSTEMTELIFTDQVIAEWVVANQLSAISADIGTVAAGTIQSFNLSGTEGALIELGRDPGDNESIKLGGTVDPKLHWDGATDTLTVKGVIEVQAGSDIPWDEINDGDGKPEDNATDNSAWEADADTTKIDGGKMYVGSLIQLSEGGSAIFGDQNVIIDTAGNHGSIVVAEDGGPATHSFCELSDGDINFQYWNGSQHIPYSSLTRLESGVAQNDTPVLIPGIFKEPPKIMVSPNSIQSFNIKYKTQSQKIRFEVLKLQQWAPYQWKFTPRAILDLSEGTTGGVNVGVSTDGGIDPFWTPAVSVPANTSRLVVNFTSTMYNRSNGYRRRSGSGGKDPNWGPWMYFYNSQGYKYYVVLRVNFTDSSYKDWKPYTDTQYQNPTGFNKWTLDTGGQAPKVISSFKILRAEWNGLNNIKKISSGPQVGIGGGKFSNITIQSYTSDQQAAGFVESGTLNWIAIGR